MCEKHCGFKNYSTYSLFIILTNDIIERKNLDLIIESKRHDAKIREIKENIIFNDRYIADKSADVLRLNTITHAARNTTNDSITQALINAAIDSIDFIEIVEKYMQKK